MRGKVVTCIGASVALATALSLGPSASALVVTDSVERLTTFSGAGCETPTVESLSLPRGAGRVVAIRPKIGAVLRDFDTGEAEVARISSVRTRRQGGRRVVEFAAVGSGASCAADPSEAVAWETDFVSLVARFRRRVRVYFAGTDGRPRRRPAIAYIGAS